MKFCECKYEFIETKIGWEKMQEVEKLIFILTASYNNTEKEEKISELM